MKEIEQGTPAKIKRRCPSCGWYQTWARRERKRDHWGNPWFWHFNDCGASWEHGLPLVTFPHTQAY